MRSFVKFQRMGAGCGGGEDNKVIKGLELLAFLSPQLQGGKRAKA